MTPYDRRLNPFINRMAQDMQIRNLAASTIDSYTWHVDKFCSHFGKMPEELGLEEIRLYQIFLVNEKKSSWSSFNQAVCALRFLYEITLGKPWVIKHIPFGKRPKTLPVVLSDQEASKLIQAGDWRLEAGVSGVFEFNCLPQLLFLSPPVSRLKPVPSASVVRSACVAEKGAKKGACPSRQGCSPNCERTGKSTAQATFYSLARRRMFLSLRQRSSELARCRRRLQRSASRSHPTLCDTRTRRACWKRASIC